MCLTPIVKALNFTSKIFIDHAMLWLEAVTNMRVTRSNWIELEMALATPLS
jgi:hypothetical protein